MEKEVTAGCSMLWTTDFTPPKITQSCCFCTTKLTVTKLAASGLFKFLFSVVLMRLQTSVGLIIQS